MYAVLKMLSLPPFGFVAAIALGLVLVAAGKKRLGLYVAWLSVFAIYLLSIGIVSARLTLLVEDAPTLAPQEVARVDAGAIVVLSASASRFSREYGRPTSGFRSLYRLRYAAELHRQTGLPILVSGGRSNRLTHSLGQILAADLNYAFHVPVRWVEDRSLNTFENATLTADVLQADGIQRAFLVTEAFHMRRAMEAFQTTDLVVIPAPTGKRVPPSMGLRAFLPNINSLAESHFAIHEFLGRVWYKLRYGT